MFNIFQRKKKVHIIDELSRIVFTQKAPLTKSEQKEAFLRSQEETEFKRRVSLRPISRNKIVPADVMPEFPHSGPQIDWTSRLAESDNKGTGAKAYDETPTPENVPDSQSLSDLNKELE